MKIKSLIVLFLLSLAFTGLVEYLSFFIPFFIMALGISLFLLISLVVKITKIVVLNGQVLPANKVLRRKNNEVYKVIGCVSLGEHQGYWVMLKSISTKKLIAVGVNDPLQPGNHVVVEVYEQDVKLEVLVR